MHSQLSKLLKSMSQAQVIEILLNLCEMQQKELGQLYVELAKVENVSVEDVQKRFLSA